MAIHVETLLNKVDQDITVAISNPTLAIVQVLELLKIKARMRDMLVVEAALEEAQYSISAWALSNPALDAAHVLPSAPLGAASGSCAF